jgi:hypothetical protein
MILLGQVTKIVKWQQERNKKRFGEENSSGGDGWRRGGCGEKGKVNKGVMG